MWLCLCLSFVCVIGCLCVVVWLCDCVFVVLCMWSYMFYGVCDCMCLWGGVYDFLYLCFYVHV